MEFLEIIVYFLSFVIGILILYAFLGKKGKKIDRPNMIKRVRKDFIEENEGNIPKKKYLRQLPNYIWGKIISHSIYYDIGNPDPEDKKLVHEMVVKVRSIGIGSFRLWFHKEPFRVYDNDKQHYFFKREILDKKTKKKTLSDPIPWDDDVYFDMPQTATKKMVDGINFFMPSDPIDTRSMIGSIHEKVFKNLSTEKDNEYAESIIKIVPVNPNVAREVRNETEKQKTYQAEKEFIKESE